jgi:hypothetical protein
MPNFVLARTTQHSSGVHGVEGYAGSAVQIDFLRNYARRTSSCPLSPGDLALIVHAVNPHGMSWYRRWVELTCRTSQLFVGTLFLAPSLQVE